MPPLGFVFLLSANCHVLFLRARYAQTVLELRQHTSPSSAPADALKKFDKCRAFCYTIYVRFWHGICLVSFRFASAIARRLFFYVLFCVGAFRFGGRFDVQRRDPFVSVYFHQQF